MGVFALISAYSIRKHQRNMEPIEDPVNCPEGGCSEPMVPTQHTLNKITNTVRKPCTYNARVWDTATGEEKVEQRDCDTCTFKSKPKANTNEVMHAKCYDCIKGCKAKKYD